MFFDSWESVGRVAVVAVCAYAGLILVMHRERVTRSELDAAIRRQGIGRVEEGAALVLETDGSFSVIKADPGPAGLSALESVEGPHR